MSADASARVGLGSPLRIPWASVLRNTMCLPFVSLGPRSSTAGEINLLLRLRALKSPLFGDFDA